jgi:hypothetical protein
VDVALQIDPGLPSGQHGFGGGVRSAENEEGQAAPLVRLAERGEVDLVGELGQGAGHLHHVVVAARLDEVGALRGRAEAAEGLCESLIGGEQEHHDEGREATA